MFQQIAMYYLKGIAIVMLCMICLILGSIFDHRFIIALSGIPILTLCVILVFYLTSIFRTKSDYNEV
jgi:hypothetical protein